MIDRADDQMFLIAANDNTDVSISAFEATELLGANRGCG
jgi:hypothetical protein